MHSSLIFAATAATLASAACLNATNGTSGYINYTTVTGYFLQDEATTNASTFVYYEENFGLMNRSYPATAGITANMTQWQKFEAQVDYLNSMAPLNTAYKVLFMGRHGEGYHNAAESFYGTPAWNCYWAELNGNATVNWRDADLTPAGIAQAEIAHNFWQTEFTTQKIPYPQTYYTSPLTRCLRTANITFSGLDLPHYYPFIPTVKNLLRERVSLHTCDHRRSRSYIANLFPDWIIEPSLPENDELWNGITAETNTAQDARSKIVLDEIFSADDHTWLSFTSHSGEIASILRVLGHQTFSLATGAVIPVLVKAEFLPSGPAHSYPPYTTSTHCAAPPITSLASEDQGCVCTGGAGVTTLLINTTQAATASATASASGMASMTGYTGYTRW